MQKPRTSPTEGSGCDGGVGSSCSANGQGGVDVVGLSMVGRKLAEEVGPCGLLE